MKTIGILQPGRLGDLIICLPIANYYNSKGYYVHWPIFKQFVEMFKEAAPHINFIPVTDNVWNCIPESINALNKVKVKKIIDIAATFPGSKCTDEYVKLGDGFGNEKFDEFKYRLAKVPFENKWELIYNRNFVKEQEIYNQYVKQDKFDLVGLKHSRGEVNVQILSKNQVIHINENHSIFYWRKLLEEAENIVLVDSAMANLVEQLNLSNKKIIIRKPGQPIPTIKNKWEIK